MSPPARLLATGSAARSLMAWDAGDLLGVFDPSQAALRARPGVMEPLLVTADDEVILDSLPDCVMPVLVTPSPGSTRHPPGLHLGAAGPVDRAILDELASRPPGRLRPSPPELEAMSIGLALPMILHNLGNRLVGLVGNLELASIYPAGSERSILKVSAAREASGDVRSYLEGLTCMRSPGQMIPGTGQTPCAAALGLAGLTHGRAVVVEACPDCPGEEDTGHPPGAVSAGIALVTAALLRLRGAGRLSVSGGPCRLRISWERPDTDAPGLPGQSLVPSLLIGAAAVAAREGFRIALTAMGDLGGSVACMWDR